MREFLKISVEILVILVLPVTILRAQSEETAVVRIQELIQDGDLDSAFRMVGQALRQHPEDGRLLNLRGILHARRDELPAARKDFAEAVHWAPALTPAWQNLGRACQQLDDSACAVEAWQRVLRSKAGDREAHSSLALLYRNQGKFAESLRELNFGGQDNLEVRFSDLIALGRIAAAQAIADRLAKQPDFSEANFESMAGALSSAKAAPVVATLIEGIDRRNPVGLSSLQKLTLAYEELERTAAARQALERVAHMEPGNAAHLLELARVAEKSKDYEGALGYLAHARDLEPQNPRIHFLFGLVAGELDLPVEAKQSLDKALAIDPGNPAYNYAMGSVILKTRDAATASSYFQKFVDAKPADVSGHYALGLAYFASGDYTKAKEQMGIAIADPSASGAAEYYLGRMARLEGDLETATRRLRRSSELLPRFSETHTELARIALLQGKMEDARTELEHALKLTPESFQANQQLLVLYQRTHDSRAPKQAELLKKLDEERSRRADLMLRTIEVRP